MATIKLKKKTALTNAARKPVRHVNASKRNRSVTRYSNTNIITNKSLSQRDKEQAKIALPIKEKSTSQGDYAAINHTNEQEKFNQKSATPNLNHNKSTDKEGVHCARPQRSEKTKSEFVTRHFNQHRPNKEKHTKQNIQPNNLPRLSKVMAERGLCSRREADQWIENGWVLVNGETIDVLGTRVKPDVDIVISAYAQEAQANNITILMHKPIGYVSGQAEDGYQPAIVLVHPNKQWQEDCTQQSFQRQFLKGLAPAGRLDIDSTGLLVLTQDGRIARHLIGKDSSVEKEYLVRVEGKLSDENLTKLNYGLSLDGVRLKPAKVSWQNEGQLRFVLREGKKRQIRRMCEMVGLKVIGLKRVRIGRITLGSLPLGEWRYLANKERF